MLQSRACINSNQTEETEMTMRVKNAKINIGLMIALGAGFMTGCTSVAAVGSEPAKRLENTEKIFIDVNGSINGMFITMTDEKNPVLLFISGGPGVPEVWLNEAYAKRYPNKLAEHFTVCWWDYLGEGISYNPGITSEEITHERLASDAHAVAEYLRNTYKKDKIYLMAHSSGTNLGLYLAQTNSEDFHCYFGMGQDYVKSDRRYEEGYHFMKEEFEKRGDKKALKEMNKLASFSEDGKFKIKKPESIGRDWENILLMAGCGTTREMRSDVKDIFFQADVMQVLHVIGKDKLLEGKVSARKKRVPEIFSRA